MPGSVNPHDLVKLAHRRRRCSMAVPERAQSLGPG
jgi:hypothetical protein